MAETRELQVLRCPACNAKFTNFSVYKKTVTCPACHNVITNPVAKYIFTENPDNEYEMQFAYATCPIVENSKLDPYDQGKEYKYLRCTFSHCPHLDNFPTLWDYRKDLRKEN